MTTKAAITGSFADFKLIKTRGVAQLVIEIDLAHADAALAALGGVPQPAHERPVAVARLQEPAPEHKPDARERYARASEGEQAVVRSNLLTGDADFRAWCGAHTPKEAGEYIRIKCGVISRAELATNPDALARFLALEAKFKTEQRFGPHATKGAA